MAYACRFKIYIATLYLYSKIGIAGNVGVYNRPQDEQTPFLRFTSFLPLAHPFAGSFGEYRIPWT
jgi:hypothetical protein